MDIAVPNLVIYMTHSSTHFMTLNEGISACPDTHAVNIHSVVWSGSTNRNAAVCVIPLIMTMRGTAYSCHPSHFKFFISLQLRP